MRSLVGEDSTCREATRGMILLKEVTVTTVGKQIEVNAPLLNNDVVPVSG